MNLKYFLLCSLGMSACGHDVTWQYTTPEGVEVYCIKYATCWKQYDVRSATLTIAYAVKARESLEGLAIHFTPNELYVENYPGPVGGYYLPSSEQAWVVSPGWYTCIGQTSVVHETLHHLLWGNREEYGIAWKNHVAPVWRIVPQITEALCPPVSAEGKRLSNE